MSDKIVVELTSEEYRVLLRLIRQEQNKNTIITYREQKEQLALTRLAHEEMVRYDNEVKNNNHPYRCKFCNRQAKMFSNICGKCKKEKSLKKEQRKKMEIKLSNLWKNRD